jgi:hypothetical protein
MPTGELLVSLCRGWGSWGLVSEWWQSSRHTLSGGMELHMLSYVLRPPLCSSWGPPPFWIVLPTFRWVSLPRLLCQPSLETLTDFTNFLVSLNPVKLTIKVDHNTNARSCQSQPKPQVRLPLQPGEIWAENSLRPQKLGAKTCVLFFSYWISGNLLCGNRKQIQGQREVFSTMLLHIEVLYI